MTALSAKCPDCGSQSKPIASRSFSAARTEFAFQCGNGQCGKQFTGILELARGMGAGVQAFRAKTGDDTVTDC